MGRKHQNRRGKVGRRARIRKAKNSETAEEMLGLVGGKLDRPPKAHDDSVISTEKRSKLPPVEETAAIPMIEGSGSRRRHEEMKLRGIQRKKLLTQVSIKKTAVTSTRTPRGAHCDPGVGKTKEISDKPKFGDTVHAPSDKIAKLGLILAAKLRK